MRPLQKDVMPTKFQLLSIFTVAALAHDLSVITRLREKNAEKDEYITVLKEAIKSTHAQMDYMTCILEDHEIVPTEFDLIALNNPIVTK